MARWQVEEPATAAEGWNQASRHRECLVLDFCAHSPYTPAYASMTPLPATTTGNRLC